MNEIQKLSREDERNAISDFAYLQYAEGDWPEGWLEGCRVIYRENPETGLPEWHVNDADGLGDGNGEWFPVPQPKVKPIYVDESGNRVTVVRTGNKYEGKPLIVVTLIDDPSRGYIALEEGEGGFGNEECPSSMGRPCLTWFGPNERYKDWLQAIACISGASIYVES